MTIAHTQTYYTHIHSNPRTKKKFVKSKKKRRKTKSESANGGSESTKKMIARELFAMMNNVMGLVAQPSVCFTDTKAHKAFFLIRSVAAWII